MNTISPPSLLRLLALGGTALFAYSKLKRSAATTGSRVVSVTGQGEITCNPDHARLRVAIKTTHAVAKEASTLLHTRVSAVLNALTSQGKLPAADLKTTQLSLRQQRQKAEGQSNPEITYLAYTQISVLVRDIDQLGGILDLASEAGIDELEDLSFDIHDKQGPQRRALALAVRDAKDKAQVLAMTSGMKLGPVLHITDGPDYAVEQRGAMLAHNIGFGGAVATGTLSIQAQALVKFELLPLEPQG